MNKEITREDVLKQFPKSANYVDSHLIKPYRRCNRCGSIILKSGIKKYPYQCMHCDEDMYSIETHESYTDFNELEYCDLVERTNEILCLD